MLNLLINLDVPELQEAIGFYQRAFGFALRRRLFAGSVAELGGAAVPVYLLARAAGSAPVPGAPQLRDYAPHWTPLHLDLVVADLPTALDRALQAGASLERGPLTEAWGSLALLRDPFGHGWCLLQWQGRGYDEVAD
ncbi:VOC family protein [Aquipseudomonas alcaligenes]|uniref:Glyoxalase n=1 Tax=Aquipseudomonas alcaligenes TaxID=43263 RepID=A0AA37CCJ4_AQUAC|nr:VOC family protein [Pseudomonas alcaligenes]BCR23789.1 glyoxalase [Pseudomonas alcaligenes]GIZ65240.1 glyoxalase [Pseudomonas alcaligenes]GIZ69435.1 glyoxalase [Pseudomonas alcaligenes]GIZ73787.1 glyoxalase [Pseudomonas alcaligenes]GIZ78148.1 glyoxalase [Pseudomonas alcaligenes]